MSGTTSIPPGAPGAQCPVCKGTGFVREEANGRSAARPCPCRLAERARLRLAQSGIPARYEHCTWEEFQALNASLREALRLARQTVDQFPGGDRGLLLCGPCGAGKTHLAVAALRQMVLERGAKGLFAEFTRLLRSIQNGFDRRSETPSFAVLQPAIDADVLVLDDLGCQRATPWAMETLGLIINERYNGQRLTIITTNRVFDPPPGEESLAERIGERLASRLAEMCLTVRVDSGDFRRNVKAAQFRI